MRRLHLIVPELLSGPVSGRTTPALAALLTRGRPLPEPATTLTAALCRSFGLAADLPFAPLSLAADGLASGESCWLCADPVHLRINIDKVILDSHPPRLAPEEAGALLESLNAHFAEDGLEFHAPSPGRWYLRLNDASIPGTAPLDAVSGRAIDAYLPSGTAGRLWRTRMNEIQMLLHAHPVNAAREQRGEPTVNGVWFWGGGAAPPPVRPAYDAVFASDHTATTLAQAAALPNQAPPEGLEGLDPDIEHALVVLDGLFAPARQADVAAYHATLRDYEMHWFKPLLTKLRWGRLGHLVLEGPGERPMAARLAPADAWKFWRRSDTPDVKAA